MTIYGIIHISVGYTFEMNGSNDIQAWMDLKNKENKRKGKKIEK